MQQQYGTPGSVQRAYPQTGQPGWPVGHAGSRFDEMDVENALKGFLGQ
jgi:hypothetical protein